MWASVMCEFATVCITDYYHYQPWPSSRGICSKSLGSLQRASSKSFLGKTADGPNVAVITKGGRTETTPTNQLEGYRMSLARDTLVLFSSGLDNQVAPCFKFKLPPKQRLTLKTLARDSRDLWLPLNALYAIQVLRYDVPQVNPPPLFHVALQSQTVISLVDDHWKVAREDLLVGVVSCSKL